MKHIVWIICILIHFAGTVQAQDSVYVFLDEIYSKYHQCLTGEDVHQCDDLAWEASFIGCYKEVLSVWNRYQSGRRDVSAEDSSAFRDHLPASAQDFILQKAKTEQVLMISEAHHSSLHRVFTADLLEGLYDAGYRYLACEGIRDSLFNEKGYPSNNTGFYVNDPQFGNMLRHAVALGYVVFGYDGGMDRENYEAREIFQAKSIAAVLEEEPNAKIFVHAGWGHIREDSSQLRLMAYQFKKHTGIDPFTIDQISMSEHSSPDFEHPIYRLAMDSHDFKEPTVFIEPGSGGAFHNERTDLMVFHPRTEYRRGRPDWLYRSPRYKRKTLRLGNRHTFPLLVKAYKYDEPAEASPVDVVFVQSKESKLDLFFPSAGRYEIVLQGKEGLAARRSIKLR